MRWFEEKYITWRDETWGRFSACDFFFQIKFIFIWEMMLWSWLLSSTKHKNLELRVFDMPKTKKRNNNTHRPIIIKNREWEPGPMRMSGVLRLCDQNESRKGAFFTATATHIYGRRAEKGITFQSENKRALKKLWISFVPSGAEAISEKNLCSRKPWE